MRFLVFIGRRRIPPMTVISRHRPISSQDGCIPAEKLAERFKFGCEHCRDFNKDIPTCNFVHLHYPGSYLNQRITKHKVNKQFKCSLQYAVQ